jgi:26S proteasome regulatory subunit T2
MDDTDPLVTVMKVEKAPQETYADIGGLDNQIQEIKVWWGPGLGFQSFGFL